MRKCNFGGSLFPLLFSIFIKNIKIAVQFLDFWNKATNFKKTKCETHINYLRWKYA